MMNADLGIPDREPDRIEEMDVKVGRMTKHFTIKHYYVGKDNTAWNKAAGLILDEVLKQERQNANRG